jgi:flagellar hook assembly protein FlgD
MAYSRNLNSGNGIELFRVPDAGNLVPTGVTDKAETRFHISCYPNPLTSRTEITYSLMQSSRVRISIYDMNGRLIQCLANGNEPAGDRQVVWNAEKVAPGYYMGYFDISNQQERFQKTVKMKVIK